MFSVVLLGSCNKYSDKVAGTYIGQISINDSITSMNSNIIISEISNKRISIEGDYFNINELEIETDDESWFEKFNPIRLIKNNEEEENIDIQIIE